MQRSFLGKSWAVDAYRWLSLVRFFRGLFPSGNLGYSYRMTLKSPDSILAPSHRACTEDTPLLAWPANLPNLLRSIDGSPPKGKQEAGRAEGAETTLASRRRTEQDRFPTLQGQTDCSRANRPAPGPGHIRRDRRLRFPPRYRLRHGQAELSPEMRW